MLGGISAANRVWDASGVTVSNSGQSYLGSDVNAILHPHLSNHYKMDLSGANVQALNVTWSTTVSVRIVGLCGINTSAGSFSGWDKMRLTFWNSSSELVSLRTDFDASVLYPDCTILAVFDAAHDIDEVRVIPFDDSSSHDWASVGTLWAGPGFVWGQGQDGYLDADRPIVPMNADLSAISRGRQISSSRGKAYRQATLPVFRAGGVAQIDETSETSLLGISMLAGSSQPVVAVARSGDARESIYGQMKTATEIVRSSGDFYGQRVVIDELD